VAGDGERGRRRPVEPGGDLAAPAEVVGEEAARPGRHGGAAGIGRPLRRPSAGLVMIV
jgi:hypothetical protein